MMTMQKLFEVADAVAFDVDSTVIQEECINVLAECCGQAEVITQLTTAAMNGNVLFHDAFQARLNLMKPSKSIIEQCLRDHPPCLTNGIAEVFTLLRALGKEVYLVSGGFRELIAPIATQLNISDEYIYANRLLFNEDGTYSGYDTTEPTAWAGGKAKAIEMIQQNARVKRLRTTENSESERRTSEPSATVIMVGDGATDLEARPPASGFVGYGGVIVREVVQNEADWFILDWQPLIDLLKLLGSQNQNTA